MKLHSMQIPPSELIIMVVRIIPPARQPQPPSATPLTRSHNEHHNQMQRQPRHNRPRMKSRKQNDHVKNPPLQMQKKRKRRKRHENHVPLRVLEDLLAKKPSLKIQLQRSHQTANPRSPIITSRFQPPPLIHLNLHPTPQTLQITRLGLMIRWLSMHVQVQSNRRINLPPQLQLRD